MDYSPTLCFAGFNSKRRISTRKKRKRAITAVYVAKELCVLQQTSKQMVKEICHDNISSVATQKTEYRRKAMSGQKIACREKTWEECNKSTETKKLNIATRFVSWMSTPGRTYRDIKVLVTTLETKESRNSIATRYLMSRQEIKYQYMKITVTNQFILRHNEKYKAESMSR